MTAMSMRTWLKSLRTVNDAHLSIMTLSYDLEGALAADQPSLAWWAQERVLLESVRLFTLEADIEVDGIDEVDESFRRLERLSALNPALAERAWQLWMRSLPGREDLQAAVEETFTFVREDLGLPWALDRSSAVLRWAESTQVMRAVARNLGIAQTDDWYLTSADGADGSWYDDVLRALESDRS